MFKTCINRSTVEWPFWKKFIFGGVGSIAGTMLIGKNFFEFPIKYSVSIGVGCIVVIWIIRFLYVLVSLSIEYWHNIYVDSIWGSAIVTLKNAYSEIHQLRQKEEFSDKEFVAVMLRFCDALKTIFDNKTKSNCCVSIKVTVSENDSLETLVLKNLCRDSHHQNRDTEQYKSIQHTIIGNTAYTKIVLKILKGNQKHLAYINNDIPNSNDYENTSKECYTDGILPYQSELVYPIVPIKGNEISRKRLKGFICIDCNKPNKFDEKRYDIPMIEGVADGIYDLFVRRNSRKEKEDE